MRLPSGAQRRAKSDTRDTPGAEPFAMSAAIQVSHLHITDRATEAALRILSYYEMAGLRRRAEYGDDSAAFQMGMAYEIGRGVPQRCTTAAQWVARAAGEDNAAAQYNLGLRYRDGDGVAVDEDEAVKWLKKAASKQNSDAQVALGALTAHQARVVPSSQTSQ
jgi:TPR repeat protein